MNQAIKMPKKAILIVVIAIMILFMAIYQLLPGVVHRPMLSLNRSLAGLEHKTISIDRHTIHYLEGGKGPTIVLIHGIFSEKDHWVDFARHLTSDYHVVIPDLAGFGESTRLADYVYSYQNQTQLLREFIQKLNLGAYHLAGNSMGGTIAALYSLRFSEEVLSLAFIGGPHGIKTPKLSEMDQQLAQNKRPLVPQSEAEFESMLELLFEKRPFIPGPILKVAREKSLAQQDENARIFDQQLKDRYLLQEILPSLSHRTFALWGSGEKIFDPSGAIVLKETLKDMVQVEMIEAGHMPQMEMPKEAAQKYKTFLSSMK